MGFGLQEYSSGICIEYIGGYQVMEKYLKDRKGRLMDDPGHYCKMATAIAETMMLQKQVDVGFERLEESVLP